MSGPELPIACTLTQEELAARRNELLQGLLSRADSKQGIAGGFRWTFGETKELLHEVARVIDAERICCPFLRFRLTLEPDGGPLILEVSGPQGTEKFLESMLSGIQAAPKPGI